MPVNLLLAVSYIGNVSRAQRSPSLSRNRLHLRFCVRDNLIDGIGGVIRALQHLQPGPLICSKNVNVYGVLPTVRALATSCTSGSALKYLLSTISARVVRLRSLA